MTCGGGGDGALEELGQLPHSVSESLRSFGRWVGSVPAGFVLDNVSDFIRSSVGFGLRMRFLIVVFSLHGGKFQQIQEFSRCI